MTRAARLLAAVSAAAAMFVALAGPATARTRMTSIFQDDCLLVQLDADRHCRTSSRNGTLDAIRDLGADVVKVGVIRDKVRRYGWSAYDAVVGGTLARGMRPFLALTGRGRGPSVRSYVRFVRSAVRRYPQVHLWSLYNEPNHREWLRSASPRTYRALFTQAQSALRRVRGHARDIVLLGELAPRSTSARGGTVGPLAFLRGLLCLDARLRPYRGAEARRRRCAQAPRLTANGFAFHPYTNGRGVAPPTFVDPADGASVATLGRITRILDAAVRAGRLNRMPLWVTEMAYQSRPPYPYGAPLATQAARINETDRMLYRNRRVVSLSQYDLDDVNLGEPAGTGLRFVDGRRKPSWNAYRLPIWVTRGTRRRVVTVWGQVRPGGATTATVEKQAGGRRAFRVVGQVRTNPSGYFQRSFRGAGRDRFRLTWNGFRSRTASIR